MSTSIIEGLIGRELSSVEFVMDYVQMRFQGPCLSAYIWPVVTRGEIAIDIGSPGYRDELVNLIGQSVTTAAATVDDAIKIAFSNGTLVEISLRAEDYKYGPEAAMLSDLPDGAWDVW